MSSQLHIKVHHESADGFILDVDATLPLNGISALFGPSGSGKTTLLNCIAGLRPDIHGAHITFGNSLWQDGTRQTPPWDRALGYVFQDARLFPYLSVSDNLDFAATRGSGNGPSANHIIQWLEIASLLERMPDTLSAGQAQRVAIARALLRGPSLLLLDEPLANLDRQSAAQCLQCLARIARESALPMLFVSHRIEEVAAIADRLLLLRDGRVEAQGPLPEFLSRLDNSLADEENAAAILSTTVLARDDEFALTELRADGYPLFVPGIARAGDTRRLRVAARDVSVCRQRPQETSILNILPVTVDSLRRVSPSHCLLRLKLREQFLIARITERSRRELAIEVGHALFAQIKSSALLDDRAAP